MEQLSNTNELAKLPPQDLIQEVASHLNVSEAFIEKDWFAVQALKIISSRASDIVDIQTIFSGGTSLSKGYKLIQRFSEDLDFRCHYLSDVLSQGRRRKCKSNLRDLLASSLTIDGFLGFDQNTIEQGGSFFKFPLQYPKATDSHNSLRRDLELEFSFTVPLLPPELRPITSMVNEFLGEQPETSILCMQPIETAADKLSALTWRVLARSRDSGNDDPTLVRHIHDLCALEQEISKDPQLFKKIAINSFNVDQRIPNREVSGSFAKSVSLAVGTLKVDSLYAEEYSRFAEAMSYANDDEQIDFSRAISSLESTARLF